MPFSGNDFVDLTINHIRQKYDKDTYIIDIGAGAGKFGSRLKSQYRIDAIEIWKPYISEFSLHDIYLNVFNVDAVEFDNYDQYNLVIMWKTLEHLSFEDARILIDNIKKSSVDFIFSVPYKLVQGVCHDNKYEIHKQDDLTLGLTLERYPEFDVLFTSEHHGVFKLKRWS